jgi:hypothetical protein
MIRELNAFKKYIMATSIATVMALNNQYASASQEYSDVYAKNDTILSQNDITVRKSAGTKYYVTKSEAEKSLDELCRKAEKEDAWIQYGDTLFDIGEDGKRNKIIIYGDLIDSCVCRSNEGDTLTISHIHPNSYLGDRFYPPSTADIMTHSFVKELGRAKNITIIQKVFDGRGMWEFDVSDTVMSKGHPNWHKVKELYKKVKSAVNEGYHIDMWENNMPKSKAECKSNHALNQYSPTSVQKYINNMSKIGVRLKYTPMEEIQGR